MAGAAKSRPKARGQQVLTGQVKRGVKSGLPKRSAKAAEKPSHAYVDAGLMKPNRVDDAVAACADRNCPKPGASFAVLRARNRTALAVMSSTRSTASAKKTALNTVRKTMSEVRAANKPDKLRYVLNRCAAEVKARRHAFRSLKP